jgi:uncharacterized protein (TIGR03067 family)
MRARILMFAAASLLLIAADAKEAELKKLEGSWKIVSIGRQGEALKDAGSATETWTVKGDQYTAKAGSAMAKYRLNVDPNKRPRTIDQTLERPDGKLVPMYGIYELNGDNLKICLSFSGKEEERPDSFTTPMNSNRIIYVLKREKK